MQVAAHAQAALRAGKSEIEVRLDPPDWGRIRVRVTSGAEGVTAHIEASMAPVREVLESNLPALRHALAQAGVNVDRFSVSVGLGHHQWEQGPAQPPQPAAAPGINLRRPDSPAMPPSALLVERWGGGQLLDAFA
jgi:flagellar hook-length control protein FliK